MATSERPHRNRVTPFGEIVASPLRGALMGNRGCLHVGHEIVRPWNGKRWIACALEFKGWVAPKWAPGRWTALFFHDEAVALAAGHRPCALCRRADYDRYRAALGIDGADAIDALLHRDRLDGRAKRTRAMAWRAVPPGAFVEIDGGAHLVEHDRVRAWTAASGYGEGRRRPEHGDANVLTPAPSIVALLAGYAVQTA